MMINYRPLNCVNVWLSILVMKILCCHGTPFYIACLIAYLVIKIVINLSTPLYKWPYCSLQLPRPHSLPNTLFPLQNLHRRIIHLNLCKCIIRGIQYQRSTCYSPVAGVCLLYTLRSSLCALPFPVWSAALPLLNRVHLNP